MTFEYIRLNAIEIYKIERVKKLTSSNMNIYVNIIARVSVTF